jgi:hypothetical protein
MVNALRPDGRRTRTGIALSLTELLAVDARLPEAGGHLWRKPLDPPDANGGGWPSLAAAFAKLAETVGPARMAIALMPPLTEVRRLDLPPIKPEQARQLLSRNAGRYFLTAREPQFVGITGGRNGPRRSGPVVGAAAAARIVNAIYAAASASGWTVEGIAPAEIAWRTAAMSIWPQLQRGPAHVLVHHADRTDLLQLDDGGLSGVRRFRPGVADAPLIEGALAESRRNGTPPRVGSLGQIDQRLSMARALSRAAATVSEPPSDWTGGADDPMYIAASFVTLDDGLTLRTEGAAELRAASGRRLTTSLLAATFGLVLISALLELWGVKRELAAVNAERARLRPQLESTLAGRTSFETSTRRLSALLAAQRQSPYLSGVIASVTDVLPEDAYILSFRTRGDTLLLDGLAKNAAAAFDALGAAPDLANVRSAAGVQRQLQDDGTALEHFTIQGRMLLPQPRSSPARGRAP